MRREDCISSSTTLLKRGGTIGTHGPIERARPLLEAVIQEITGAKVLGLHHDISTVTGEEVVFFTLAKAPECRQPKKRQSHESEDWDSQ